MMDSKTNTANESDSRKAFGDEGVSRSAVPTAEMDINESSLDKPASPRYRQLPDSPLPQTIEKPIVERTEPSGFGLPLNSITTSVQCGTTVSMDSGSPSIPGKSSSITGLNSSEGSSSCPLSCNEENQLLAKINNEKIDRDQAVAATSEAVPFTYSAKLPESESLNPLEPMPYDKKVYSNTNEEIRQSRLKQKRLKKLDVDDNADCKRCYCINTQCLNLIACCKSCNCFSAGVYCAEHCDCQGCINRPEHVEKVFGARGHIELWNPYAFVPKITQHASEASSKTSMVGLLEDRGKSTANININVELRQSSPKQKRFKKFDVNDNAYCKRCNSKKIKCLDL